LNICYIVDVSLLIEDRTADLVNDRSSTVVTKFPCTITTAVNDVDDRAIHAVWEDEIIHVRDSTTKELSQLTILNFKDRHNEVDIMCTESCGHNKRFHEGTWFRYLACNFSSKGSNLCLLLTIRLSSSQYSYRLMHSIVSSYGTLNVVNDCCGLLNGKI
jgi:hypothetical protein